MNREHQLSFCEKCTKREFSPKEGIVCSLTSAQATFEKNCVDFEVDPNMVRWKENVEKDNTRSDNMKKTLGFSAFGPKNGMIASGAFILILLITNLWTIFSLGIISFWMVGLFVAFIVGFVNSIRLYSEDKKRKLAEEDERIFE